MIRSALDRILTFLRESDTIGPVLLAVTVGVVGGTAAILFRYLILGSQFYFFEVGAQALPFLGDAYVIILPAIGLVLVGFMVRRWAPEAEGHGVPEVMFAVKKRGGRIRPRVALVKSLASALTIGSGGSVGREGPIVQIGCTFGSAVGQLLGLREQQVKLMLACGAAAAVAGTFNAPIAGVIFALEVILGNWSGRSFGYVVVASVTATALCQSVLGTEPAFPLAEVFVLNSAWEFPLYVALGLGAGIIALAFVRTLYFSEDLFAKWTWAPALKNVVGGLALGGVAYFGYILSKELFLFGVGYNGIEAALDGKIAMTVLILLLFLKILATSLTLGAGGSGGVFAPSLFIGAMAGGAFGLAVNAIFPGIPAPAGAYALVGMAAVFAGTAHAPITAIVILFEMTDDYKIILPLMIAVVISHLISSTLSHDSIYTIKLRRRGGLAPKKSEVSMLDFILVADAMSSDVETITPDTPVADLAKRFHSQHDGAFPVVDEKGDLVGIVTENDVESALMEGNGEKRTAGDIMTRGLITCTSAQSLRDVLRLFRDKNVRRIPVVEKDNPKKVIGMLRRQEIFWAYGVMSSEHERLLERTGVDLPTRQKDSIQVEIEVKPEHRELSQRRVKDVRMPDDCLIVMLRRADDAIIPRGKTTIEPGDYIVVLTTRENEKALRAWAASLDEGNPAPAI